MTQQVDIECGAYTVTLTGTSIDVFSNAAKLEQVQGKAAEELVTALLEAAGGGISEIERKNKDGQYNDGPNGEPAVQAFYANGKLSYAARYKDGQYNDGPNGEPAVQIFDYNSTPIRIVRYRDGKCNDGPNGEPACQWFDVDGKLTRAERFEDDQYVKMLTVKEITACQAQIEKVAKISDIAAKVPAMKIRP